MINLTDLIEIPDIRRLTISQSFATFQCWRDVTIQCRARAAARGIRHDVMDRGNDVFRFGLELSHVLAKAWIHQNLSFHVGNLPSENDAVHRAADFHASERSPLGFGERHGVRDDPFIVEIDFDIGVRLVWDVENTFRVAMEFVDKVLLEE